MTQEIISKKINYPSKYLNILWTRLHDIEIIDKDNNNYELDLAINKIVEKINEMDFLENKVIFIGNGGSAGIASHQAIDYWKNGKIPATAFNDPSMLTCLSNDYGYEYVFEKPINMFAKAGDILIAISSSGKSKNIINAVKAAREKGLFIITLSGFSNTNPLRTMGDLNFYVPSKSYGHVEISHLIMSHTFLDCYMESEI